MNVPIGMAISSHHHHIIFIVRSFFSYLLPGHKRRKYDPSAPVSPPALRPGGVDMRERVEGCQTMSSVPNGTWWQHIRLGLRWQMHGGFVAVRRGVAAGGQQVLGHGGPRHTRLLLAITDEQIGCLPDIGGVVTHPCSLNGRYVPAVDPHRSHQRSRQPLRQPATSARLSSELRTYPAQVASYPAQVVDWGP